jgi:hypothetical protein
VLEIVITITVFVLYFISTKTSNFISGRWRGWNAWGQFNQISMTKQSIGIAANDPITRKRTASLASAQAKTTCSHASSAREKGKSTTIAVVGQDILCSVPFIVPFFFLFLSFWGLQCTVTPGGS